MLYITIGIPYNKAPLYKAPLHPFYAHHFQLGLMTRDPRLLICHFTFAETFTLLIMLIYVSECDSQSH